MSEKGPRDYVSGNQPGVEDFDQSAWVYISEGTTKEGLLGHNKHEFGKTHGNK